MPRPLLLQAVRRALLASRALHSSAPVAANNMPKKMVAVVPMPKKMTLEDLGLDTSVKRNISAVLMSDEMLAENDIQTTLRRETKTGVTFKRIKITSPSLRWYRKPVHSHLWKGRPFRRLTIAKRKTGGRNFTGRITARHIGGGHKRRLRIVDFMRSEPGAQTVVRIEYDPGRTSHIALISHNETKKLSYIIAPNGLRSGDQVESYRAGLPQDLKESSVDVAVLNARTIQRGNCLPLSMIPLGTVIHNIGLHANAKAQLCRAAGSFARLLSKHYEMSKGRGLAVVRLNSGEERFLPLEACATVGVASNAEHQFYSLGKAGRSRWLGRRPHVRGVAMNAHDHPHGGGRGKSKGNVPSQSPWGTLAKGFKTRKGKHANKMKVRDRPRGKKGQLAASVLL